MDLDSLCRHARDHQQQLLDEAARARLLAHAVAPRPLRARLANALRRVAERLEPSSPHATLDPTR